MLYLKAAVIPNNHSGAKLSAPTSLCLTITTTLIDPNGLESYPFVGNIDPSYPQYQKYKSELDQARNEAAKTPNCISKCVLGFATGAAGSEAASRGLIKAAESVSQVCATQAKRMIPGVNLVSTGQALGNTAGCIEMCVYNNQ